MTITEAFATFDVDRLYAEGKSPKTRRNYRSTLNSFVKCNTDLPLMFVTYNTILVWKQDLAHQGMQPSSMHEKISHMRNVLRYLEQHGHEVIDYRNIDSIPVKRKVPVWLTVPEIGKFLSVIESPRDKALFACLFDSAARIGELLQLNRDSIVDGDAEIIGKGDKPGYLHFDSSLPALESYLATRDDSLRPLFISGQRRRITVSRVQQLAHEYADLAGIDKNVTPHVFRHSRASDFYTNSHDIYAVKQQLRHARIDTTQIYVHTAQDQAKIDHKLYGTKVPLS